MIFDIQRFSTHDGPGVRTVVFFKGCPLRCPWCENPESQSFRPELFYDSGRCIGCLDCLRAGRPGEVEAVKRAAPSVASRDDRAVAAVERPQFHRERMDSLDCYRGVCPSEALRVVGEEYDVDGVVAAVERDRPFYGEEGGATLSGGEPFAQPPFALALSRGLFERGIDVAVESSLGVAWSAIEPSLPFLSLLLADLKHVNAGKYRDATGGSLATVIENFRLLEAARMRVAVRIPVVPGFNDSPPEMEELLAFAAGLSNVGEVHLLPYHTMGKAKYELLGRSYPMESLAGLPAEELSRYADAAESAGLRVTIGG